MIGGGLKMEFQEAGVEVCKVYQRGYENKIWKYNQELMGGFENGVKDCPLGVKKKCSILDWIAAIWIFCYCCLYLN